MTKDALARASLEAQQGQRRKLIDTEITPVRSFYALRTPMETKKDSGGSLWQKLLKTGSSTR